MDRNADIRRERPAAIPDPTAETLERSRERADARTGDLNAAGPGGEQGQVAGDPPKDDAERRARQADQRDSAGDRRDERGARRDEVADRRDAAAARRDRAAELHEAVVAASLARTGLAADAVRDAAHVATRDRRHAAEDRDAAAVERWDADHDRGAAWADRGSASSDRGAASAELEAASQASAASRDQAERLGSDPLTDLANHTAFQRQLQREFDRAQRHDRALSLALVDIDHFRGRNDTFGHPAGDAVLVDVARHLERTVRSADLVARIRGDTFAVLMPETPADVAEAMAARAREAIRDGFGEGLSGVTVSVGICDTQHAATAEDLIRLADGALYWAKANGRDAVWRYSPEAVEDLSFEQRAARLARLQALAGVRTLARAIDAKDHSTRLHSERVARLATRLGESLGWAPERVAALHEAALVHDVGKIGVADAVLLKRGRLDPDEYEAVKAHAVLGAEIASEVLSDEQTTWIRQHHERYDGGGYPAGLAANEISDGAQVLAVADSWDVMTSERPYAAAMPVTAAINECRRCVGRQFDPDVVGVLTAPEFERTLRTFANEQAARQGNDARLSDAADSTLSLRCECGEENCGESVEVPVGDYRVIRLHARRYLVHPGHELPSEERVLSRNHRYNVVEKT